MTIEFTYGSYGSQHYIKSYLIFQKGYILPGYFDSLNNFSTRFDIGTIQTPALYSTHAKVSESSGDLIDFLIKTTRGANANGQLKLIVKNAISANGQFKVTDSDGKGNGMIIVDFKQVRIFFMIAWMENKILLTRQLKT